MTVTSEARASVEWPKLRLAFVVQRYGVDAGGGAELLCRLVAEHLVPYAEVDVITSCARDYTTWANDYAKGRELLNGVVVHRFPVDHPRHVHEFDRWERKMLVQSHTLLDEYEWMRHQGPVSSGMLSHINERADDYDLFFYVTYLYASTYFGLQLVPEKSVLIPAAHDEPSLYLALFRSTFQLPRYIVFNTEAERRLVHSVFRNSHIPSSVIGTGIEPPSDADPERFRKKYGIQGNFVVYVGRMDASKNVPELVDFFQRYRRSTSTEIKLVLLGKGPYHVGGSDDIIPLGYVSEQDKFDALSAADLLILPSDYESLSIVMLEAWLMSCPVLVNGMCDVLVEQCQRSNGGLYYQSYSEFAILLELLMQDHDLRQKLGLQGHHYAQYQYNWTKVEKAYLQVIAQMMRTNVGKR